MGYINEIDKSIGTELNSSSIESIELTHEILYDMWKNISEYYLENPFPAKKSNQLRPYLSYRYPIGKKIHKSVNKYYKKIGSSTIKFQRPENFPLRNLLKKHLLYVDSICIHDPLIYLLDYFKYPESTNTNLKFRIDAVKYILEEYASLRNLIDQDIITFQSQENTGIQFANDFYLNAEESKTVANLLPYKIVPSDISMISKPILQDMDISRRLNGNIDLYFPTAEMIELYSAILRTFQQKFDSKYVIQPYLNSIIGEIDHINPNKVSVEDIINIRKNEETFRMWREFVEDILGEFYRNRILYTDSSLEFTRIAKEKFLDLDNELKKRLHKSYVLKNITSKTEKAIIGVGVGALSGMALDMNAMIPMMIGGVTPFVELVVELIKQIFPMSETISINNHFYSLKLH